MGKRDEIYRYFSENGYPKDQQEKEEFAARFLGARLVGAMDSVLEDKIELLNTEQEGKLALLNTLSGEQKEAVEELIKKSVSDFFYWLLVKMNSFPDRLELNAMELDEETDEFNLICNVGDEVELHHRYFDWIEEFSDIVEESN